ncbi:hypothetical protein [Paraburkholderia sp. SOS3]|uniref:hypothetical protein n=1 Tax=Paraburkholderia sp. SOS3 TaxID=1926494 RepID=UPI0012EBA373|nr:hypothetical protein [Paraburkholderia sp. SOS3]
MTLNTPEKAVVSPSRHAMELIAREFNAVLGNSADAGLALVVDNLVALNIAPVGAQRIAAFCHVGDASRMTPDAWISMLSEAALWGIDGEAMRFGVLDDFVALMWSFPPTLPDAEIVGGLRLMLERAVAVARMVRKSAVAAPVTA